MSNDYEKQRQHNVAKRRLLITTMAMGERKPPRKSTALYIPRISILTYVHCVALRCTSASRKAIGRIN